ncbi:transketolase [Lachnoanaerobaculum umeaense]|uniref:Transketolase n=1 Tax=Lachnoanaerobaculum umeaense TaxID=617123 RepID=A0A385Q2I4_9FIRM|nr:transketolase [Lachnoanaerobaculum umeaense]AYA99824.1 transketolase [Lachnoanaerobaculum umeaense]PZW96807.1 transketolase [Lachnoanaerobaculum umeaense]
MSNIDIKSVNTIRTLSADGIEKAKSGHPGLPLGSAPIAYELFAHHMKHNPKNPGWKNRDRFILSAGHGSMLLYSLFHLFGYGDLSLEDLKSFRQLDSKTPGHPEYGHTIGVEATTGPLGAGMGMAVGMAMAEAHMESVFNKDGFDIVDHYTYVLGGDGCMMEGISSEAFSLAGTLGLSKLIVFYDSNGISIEGSTDIAFTENVVDRMKAFGFQTIEVEDGNDTAAIGKAIEEAKADKSRPSFIKINTIIGYGAGKKQGTAGVHGEPLGSEALAALKTGFGFDPEKSFDVDVDVYENFKAINEKNAKLEEEWNERFKEYASKYPQEAKDWDNYHSEINTALIDNEEFWSWDDAPAATRNISGSIINRLKDIFPNLVGGSADLSPSNKTEMKSVGYMSKDDFSGRNIHFGVREFAMTAITNGIVLHGGLRAYCATFFVFSDYTKPMARLSALMNIPTIFVFTHDSIGVGEDGPTHEPIEQLAMLRSLPNFNTFRPADARETIAAWYAAMSSKSTPTAIVLTRQNLPQLNGSGKKALNGGYIIKEASKNTPDMILIASGSEVSLAVDAAVELENDGISTRVVSMPCMDIFENQSKEYKEEVLPRAVRNRVAIEALSGFGWDKYTGLDGRVLSMNSFGASAPQDLLFKKFGFTKENVVSLAKEVFNQ